jgi:radical SAM superfamily enzyme YgiQ (UPF0313 family)
MKSHPVKALLISSYELGHQPFGLASPTAWLRRAGASVSCLDLSREPMREPAVRSADLIAFYVPMHTATRLAVEILPVIRRLNPSAHICFYGLYAPVNERYLRSLGADTILGGEFETGIASLLERLQASREVGFDSTKVSCSMGPGRPEQHEPVVSLERQTFLTPDRSSLPPLSRYARLTLPNGEKRVVGYTEASRGCKHLCRHCPIVPVYGGRFRIVQQPIVMEDIRQQVAVGAEHITFGDPDFFNAPRHAVGIVTALGREFSGLTYDVTIKIEHLLKHAQHLRTLHDTGCLFVTSAVESVEDGVLARLDKGHTYADFASVVGLFREVGLTLSPTFLAFTPWTTRQSYCDLLQHLVNLDLIENVAPIQLAIRLLIPAGSRLRELPEVREIVGEFDEAALVYPWANEDPGVEELCSAIQKIVQHGESNSESRRSIFSRVWSLAHEAAGLSACPLPDDRDRVSRAAIPFLTEPWYC